MDGVEIISFYRSRFLRNLDMFIDDFSRIPPEKLWETRGAIKNSAGVLGMHVTGNLNHFFGHALGGSDYIRQRDKEFIPVPGRSRDEILTDLRAARSTVDKVLSNLNPEILEENFPAPVFGDERMNCYEFLLHLYHHLSYHTGQLNYLIRG
jgi:uncharacterized damage-inducible protein DinB